VAEKFTLDPRAPDLSRRRFYNRTIVADLNRREVGCAFNVVKRRGSYYVVVKFSSRVQELLLLPDDADSVATPHHIHETQGSSWYHWLPNENYDFINGDATGSVVMDVEVGTPERASSERQATAAARLGEVLAEIVGELICDADDELTVIDSHVSWIERRDARAAARFDITVRGEIYADTTRAAERISRLVAFLQQTAADASWRQRLGDVATRDVHFARFKLEARVGSELAASFSGRILP
jgi:hypothetical protein